MRAVSAVLLAFGLLGCAPVMERETKTLNTVRLQEALGGYEKARSAGDPLGLCVEAKLVAIAYEDAKDAPNASAWRAREREDCQGAMAALGVTPPAELAR